MLKMPSSIANLSKKSFKIPTLMEKEVQSQKEDEATMVAHLENVIATSPIQELQEGTQEVNILATQGGKRKRI